jgi:hypothetical protein
MRITIEVPDHSSASSGPTVTTASDAATAGVTGDGLPGGAAPPALEGGAVMLATQLEAFSAGAAEQDTGGAATNGAIDALDGGAATR